MRLSAFAREPSATIWLEDRRKKQVSTIELPTARIASVYARVIVVEGLPSVIRWSINLTVELQMAANLLNVGCSCMKSASSPLVKSTNSVGNSAAIAGMFPGASKVGRLYLRNWRA